MEDAYSVRVPVAWVDQHLDAMWVNTFGSLDLFGFGSEKVTIFWLSGDATCDEPGESSSEAVDLGPRSTENPANEVDAAGQSSPVAINADDCFNDDGIVECVAEIDVIALAWEEVEGAADLLSLTVAFAGPVDGGGDVLVDVAIRPRGDGNPLGTRIEISDGVFSCKFPGSDGPLPGEECEIDEDGAIAVVRDIAGMSGRIDVAIAAIHFAEDGAHIRDGAQIKGILERE
ncbi:MAG: hypothetical protein BMS9Abin12_2060 [Acidimicrobiia bacterium]|nr:MAG: hypothetical protein BMS9Abin12_2060 [Acidimicrobiia bacterium]